MKIRPIRMILVIALSIVFMAISLAAPRAFSQSKGSGGSADGSGNGGGGTNTGAGGGGNNGGGGGGTPSASGQQGSSSATRIEASMIAYEASDKIAAHIANEVRGKKILVYDSQTFSALQAYEAYAATVSTLEIAFQVGGPSPADKSSVPILDAAQTVVSTLATLKSSTEYANVSVNLNVDALVAQVAHKIGGSSVVVPKFLLLPNGDLDSPLPNEVEEQNCADIDLGVPGQLACLMNVREHNRSNPNFTNVDKLFQIFLGSVVGNSSVAKAPAQPGDDISGTADQTNKANQNQNQNQAQSSSALPLIIQGRRLEAELTKLDKSTPVRLLVLEATEAGGSYRILHNFWVEVFWRTPTPAFNGGAIVTYFLIDPQTSIVEKSEVLSYIYKFSKFKEMRSAPNPGCSWQQDLEKCGP